MTVSDTQQPAAGSRTLNQAGLELHPRVLVTGGAGFIGSCLVRKRLEAIDSLDVAGAKVVVLDKLSYAGSRLSLPHSHAAMEFVEGDVRDLPLVRGLLKRHSITAIVHLAAETHVDRSIESAEAFVQNNVVGACRLLQAALDYWRDDSPPAFRLVHVSTDEVYGSLGPDGKFSETTAYDPSSPYSASKAAADHFVRAFHRTHGLPAVITNCSNNFGPYQFPEKLIPVMILNALEGRPLPIYGDGQQVRDWLFVEDHVAGLEAVLEHGRCGESYNLGGNCERKNLDLVHTICDLVDKHRPHLAHAPCRRLVRHVKDRPGHDARYAIDSSKMRRELDWQPASSFDQRLEETVLWYLEHSQWLADLGAHRQRRGLRKE